MVFYAAFNCICHITATEKIINVFPPSHQYEAGALKCLDQGHFHEKKLDDPVHLDTWVTSQTLYHWATQDPKLQTICA